MIFLDTSFIVAYKIENDANHEKAKGIIKKIAEGEHGLPVISDYVFDETITFIFAKSKLLSLTVEIGNELRSYVEIVKIDELLFEDAWKIFENQKNTKFSFTDCTIIALMNKNKIKTLATFDNEFKKINSIEVVQ